MEAIHHSSSLTGNSIVVDSTSGSDTPRRRATARITLKGAIIGALGAALLAGIVPACLTLDHRLTNTMQRHARESLARVPDVFVVQMAAYSDALLAHAKDLASVPGLAGAVVAGDSARAHRLLDGVSGADGVRHIILVGPGGERLIGPPLDTALIARTRAGELPVSLTTIGGEIGSVAVAPIAVGSRWTGAVGLVKPIDGRTAKALSGMTRSGVVVLGVKSAIASTLDATATRAVERAAATGRLSTMPADIHDGGRTLIAVSAPLDSVGSIVFTRAIDSELVALPGLRRVLVVSSTSAILVALVLGVILAGRIAYPVRELSLAARAAEGGDFGAPVPTSRVQEVQTLSAAFGSMRRSLARRLEELREANAALVDRTARVTALQAEFMRHDRLRATGRLVAQLAHEIRNPIGSVRNCLELIRRRVAYDPETREFADLAIDELLRMHALAERMLDLDRPRDSGMERCRPLLIARDVARLSVAGAGGDLLAVDIQGDDQAEAAIAPDALKQVLLNLVQNAREAFEAWTAKPAAPARVTIRVSRTDKEVVVEVRDNGPGIPNEVLPRVFDPFFTTKGAVHGVGLGLFVAEGLVRAVGGRITAGSASEANPEHAFGATNGAWFRIQLPSASPSYSPVANPARTSV